ncbi:MAG: extracellular solute-binding protein [bacterium]
MINENKYFLLNFSKTVKIRILTAFLVVCSVSCDFNSDKNLLTFYYHAEDSTKKREISGIINDFSSATGIEVIIKEYFSDDIYKIINRSNEPFDVIELEKFDLLSSIQSGAILNFDSIPPATITKRKYNYNNFLVPWLIDYNLLCFNNDFILKSKIKTPIITISDLLKICAFIDTVTVRSFGIVVNDKKKSLNNLLLFLNWNDCNIEFSNDSVTYNTPVLVNTFVQYQNLSKYSFLGTQNEIENAFLSGKIAFCIGNSQLLKKIQMSPGKKSFDFQVLKTSTGKTISTYCKSYLAISKNSRKVENSVKLINFLTADTTREILNKKLLHEVFLKNGKNENFFLPASLNYLPQMINKQITYEIDKAITSLIIGQDSVYNVIEKTHRKINKLIRQKKHRQYK